MDERPIAVLDQIQLVDRARRSDCALSSSGAGLVAIAFQFADVIDCELVAAGTTRVRCPTVGSVMLFIPLAASELLKIVVK